MNLRLVVLTMLAASPVAGSTPASFAALDRQSARACTRAAGLNDTQVAPPTRFSDRMLIDARVVTGKWRPAHMKGASATMLCLYNRRTRRAEVQEMVLPVAAAAMLDVKDRWWQVEDLAGRRPVEGSRIVLMLGSDGKLASKACNSHSVDYALTGKTLRVYLPIVGTQMGCLPAIMAQETRFLDILGAATRVVPERAGGISLSTADGRTLRLIASTRAP